MLKLLKESNYYNYYLKNFLIIYKQIIKALFGWEERNWKEGS